jgi:hypothetical protein
MRWQGNAGKLRQVIHENWNRFLAWKSQRGELVRASVITQVIRMLACRTSLLGAHLYTCHQCGTALVVPHSCKSTACASCGKVRTDSWCNELLSDILDVPYRHLVFTIPWELRLLLKDNRDVCLNILFRAAGDAILSLTAGHPKPLGKKSKTWLAGIIKKNNCKKRRGRKRRPFLPGFISVLHSFGSDLKWNTHLHIIVTGGGLSLDHCRWIAAPKRYLVPAPLLGTEWKLRVIKGIRQAHTKRPLYCRRLRKDGRRRLNVDKLLGHIRKKRWRILIGPSLRSADKAVRYAARYSKRPVISEGRIIHIEKGYVTFRFKDYHQGNVSTVKHLPVMVFLDRLFQHFPENNFRQVRHYGLFATRNKTQSLKTARQFLAQRKKRRPAPNTWERRRKAAGDRKPLSCPRCGNKMMLWNLLFGNNNSIAHLIGIHSGDLIKPKTFISSQKVLHWEVCEPIKLIIAK